jgi:hypothetical protein
MEDVYPSSIIPTISPLAYFHSALKSISLQPDLVNRLLDLRYLKSHNMLMAWLNIGGEWREIKMDCWFPTIDLRDKKGVKKGKLKWIMSEPSKHKGEMWPMIL